MNLLVCGKCGNDKEFIWNSWHIRYQGWICDANGEIIDPEEEPIEDLGDNHWDDYYRCSECNAKVFKFHHHYEGEIELPFMKSEE